MVSLLEDYSYFQFDNYSVPKKDEIDAETEEELEQALREQQIKPASIVIALGGMYVAYSKWIKKEIILAKIEGKPILGVEPYGSAQTPNYIEEHADETVGWSGKSVVQAIRRLAE
jgi:hypothetical protein